MNIQSRAGKIARLPFAVREELNRRMEDGEAGVKVLEWLNGLPEVQAILRAEFGGKAIGKQNLWAWRHGGYRDLVMRRDAMELALRFGEEGEEIEEAVAGQCDGPMVRWSDAGLAGTGKDGQGSMPDGRASGRTGEEAGSKMQGRRRRSMVEVMAVWVTAQFGVASRRVMAARGEEHWRLLRQMVADVDRLRRGEQGGQRLELQRRRVDLQREKLEFRRVGRDGRKKEDGLREERKEGGELMEGLRQMMEVLRQVGVARDEGEELIKKLEG
ncbi:MAG: hypothetical protein ACAH88_16280, partial [Roseimicrobium sp.]